MKRKTLKKIDNSIIFAFILLIFIGLMPSRGFAWTTMDFTGEWNGWALGVQMWKDTYNTSYQHWHYVVKPSADDTFWEFKFIGDSGGSSWTNDYGDDDTDVENTGDTAVYQPSGDGNLEGSVTGGVPVIISFDTDGANDKRYEVTAISTVSVIGSNFSSPQITTISSDTVNMMKQDSSNKALFTKTVYLNATQTVYFKFAINKSSTDPIGNSWLFTADSAGDASPASSGSAYIKDGGRLAFSPDYDGYYELSFDVEYGTWAFTMLSSTHVVISEIYIDAGDDNNSEFIELYNPTNQSIDISGWYVYDGGVEADIVSGTIPAYGFFLVADGGWSTGRDNSSWPLADVEDEMGMVNTNHGFGIRNSADVLIDAIGWGTPGAGEPYEGTAEANPGSQESYERFSNTTHDSLKGNSYDTNDNATDFFANVFANVNPQSTDSPHEIPKPPEIALTLPMKYLNHLKLPTFHQKVVRQEQKFIFMVRFSAL